MSDLEGVVPRQDLDLNIFFEAHVLGMKVTRPTESFGGEGGSGRRVDVCCE